MVSSAVILIAPLFWSAYFMPLAYGLSVSLQGLSIALGDSDRPMLRARRKLGSDDGMGEPEKPNGMHWATYNRLLDEAKELDDRGW